MSHVDVYEGAQGAVYSAYIARPRIGRIVGRLLWDSDFGLLYGHLDALRRLPQGVTVVDSACGAGLVLGWLDPAMTPRYVGIDQSPAMLTRARLAARRLPAGAVELLRGDVGSLPLASGIADVCLSYNALHCVPDPPAALAELLRVCRPGGTLRGSMLVRGERRRADWVMAKDAARGNGTMGPGGSKADLVGWLQGWREALVTTAGAMAVFTGRKPS